jgi:hypothetical protein
MTPQFPNESSKEVPEYTEESDAEMLRSADEYARLRRALKAEQEKSVATLSPQEVREKSP